MTASNATKTSKDQNSDRPKGRSQVRPSSAPTSLSGPQANLLALQTAAGSRAVSQLLRQDNTDMEDTAVRSDNSNGLPYSLRAGLEVLSGTDLSQVRVHTNSSKPARFNAFAYTQGQDIHLGPGQEKYLPHEGWHAVQQLRGRVLPTMQAKGVALNDDDQLEREADQMGARASRMAVPGDRSSHDTSGKTNRADSPAQVLTATTSGSQPTMQRAMKFEFQTGNYVWKIFRGQPGLLGRKYGAFNKRVSKDHPYLARGEHGEPAVKAGDPVAPDIEKKPQYIYRYTVLNKNTGRATLQRIPNKGHRATLDWGTYESEYVDRKDRPLDVHLDRKGQIQVGPDTERRAVADEEQTAIELQSETDGFIEFETPKWFRKWRDLKPRIQDAVDMTETLGNAQVVQDEAIITAVNNSIDNLDVDDEEKENRKKKLANGSLREWPSTLDISHLNLRKGEKLLVEIVDEKWWAAIQSSEGIDLTQYESLLKEHGHPGVVKRTISIAKDVMRSTAANGTPPKAKDSDLHSFLQVIVNYIIRGSEVDLSHRNKKGEVTSRDPSKFAFRLMSRTSFSSMYRALLDDDEKALFRKLVTDNEILKAINDANPSLKLQPDSLFFVGGHGGGRGPTIQQWLNSIITPSRRRDSYGRITNKKGEWTETDLLSRPRGGSHAMGAFDVETEKGKKDTGLVKFEVRNTNAHGGRSQPASKWVEYAEKVFKYAAENRKRPSTKDDPLTPENETEKTSLKFPKPKFDTRFELRGGPRLRFSPGDVTKPEFALEFRYYLPYLIKTKFHPFIFSGVHTDLSSIGASAGGGIGFDPFADMSLYLAGKAGLRTPSFNALEFGGGLEASWQFDKSRSLRLGVEWQTWLQMGDNGQRTHLLGLFLTSPFK